MRAAIWLLVGSGLGVLVSQAPASGQEPVQVPIMLMQSDGVILDGLRARMQPDGSLAPWERWQYLGIDGGSEVLTVVTDGYYHVLSCGRPDPVPVVGSDLYMPLVVRRR
jgi:hypothetical protein